MLTVTPTLPQTLTLTLHPRHSNHLDEQSILGGVLGVVLVGCQGGVLTQHPTQLKHSIYRGFRRF